MRRWRMKLMSRQRPGTCSLTRERPGFSVEDLAYVEDPGLPLGHRILRTSHFLHTIFEGTSMRG